MEDKVLQQANLKDSEMNDAFEFINNKNEHQALIVLYGLGNKGKTSTLTDLVFLLTNARVKGEINKIFINIDKNGNQRYRDAFYVVMYKGKRIFISTGGDGREICENNIAFFERKGIKQKIHIIEGTAICELDSLSKADQNNKYYRVKPDFIVSACRTEGGSVDANMYFADKLLSKVNQEVWIRKYGMKEGEMPEYIDAKHPIITKNDNDVASDIKAFIDRVKDCKHCI